jgi:hypothetical protein
MAFDPQTTQIHDALRYAQATSPLQGQLNAQLDFSKAFEGMQNPGPFQNFNQAIDYGMKPVDGMVYVGNTMPGVGVNPMTGQRPDPNAKPTGSWQFIGNFDTGTRNPDHGPSEQGQWQWREDAKPAPVVQQAKQEEAPEPRFPDGDIYNDWDYYQKKARAEVEGMNRMPYVFSDYVNISLDPQKAMNQFYPAAWQEQGVQKTIGPNGQNIAPKLYEDFGDPQFINTTGQKDWPSLVKMLLGNGSVNEQQGQALLGLMEPKKLDTSFANQALLGR